MSGIPNIDTGLYSHPDAPSTARRCVIEEVRKACADFGFLHVKGHGVPVEVQQRMLESCKAHFDLPQDQKHALTLKNNAARRGYERAAEHILDPEALPDSKDACEHMFQNHLVGTEFHTRLLHRSRARTRPNQFPQRSESVV